MNTIEATFTIPEHISRGLMDGTLERIGGVVRDAKTKQIAAWLRETSEGSDLSKLLSLSSVAATTGVLNLAISTMGFAVVIKKLGVIEQQLRQSQEVLREIDYKIDLSFYANLRAALDLAMNAFTMANPETRRVSAMQAINRFLEAEYHYSGLTDIEIANGSQVAGEYLLTLCLAYVTEVRCYLELEELQTAYHRLQEGLIVLRPRFKKYVHTLLTSNPAAYLHPSLKNQIDLKRLTRIYQWLTPAIGESAVFEAQRENLFRLAQHPDEWINSLPPAIQIPKKKRFLRQKVKQTLSSVPGVSRNPTIEIFSRLPQTIGSIESMIEDNRRLEIYAKEVDTIHQLGLTFQEWQRIALNTQANESDLVFITVA
jgi:hypothetical protein